MNLHAITTILLTTISTLFQTIHGDTTPPYIFAEYLKLTQWEDKAIEYGHELIQDNLLRDYVASVNTHSKNILYQEPFNRVNHCWLPGDDVVQKRDFVNTYSSVVVFEKNLYLTIDFPD